jgi:hypothetical protein
MNAMAGFRVDDIEEVARELVSRGINLERVKLRGQSLMTMELVGSSMAREPGSGILTVTFWRLEISNIRAYLFIS